MGYRTAFISSLLAIGLAACAGGETKTDKSSAGLGERTTSRGEADVKTERQVTVVERHNLPTVRTATTKADINRMSKEHFMGLGFSEDIAGNIIEYREEHGGFRSIDELSHVEGVDEGMLVSVRDKLGVSSVRSSG